MLGDREAEVGLARAVIEHHPDIVVVLERSDGAVRILACNDNLITSTGWSRDEIVGRDVRDIVPPEIADALVERLDVVERSGSRIAYEVTREVPAGTRTYSSVMFAVGGTPRRLFVAVTRDITDRRSAETALADTARLARIGHWSWDVVHDEVLWSEQMYRIYGLEPSDQRADLEAVISRTHPDDREGQRERIRRLLDEGEDYRADIRIQRPDGEVRTVEVRGRTVRDHDGGLLRVAGTVQDLTEQREMQTAARAAEAALQRQAQALDLNDNVLQGLAVARLALQLGDAEQALAAVDATLEAARCIISELLSDRIEKGGLAPGDLVRGGPALLAGRAQPTGTDRTA